MSSHFYKFIKFANVLISLLNNFYKTYSVFHIFTIEDIILIYIRYKLIIFLYKQFRSVSVLMIKVVVASSMNMQDKQFSKACFL